MRLTFPVFSKKLFSILGKLKWTQRLLPRKIRTNLEYVPNDDQQGNIERNLSSQEQNRSSEEDKDATIMV